MSRETFERPPLARVVREPACWVLAGFVGSSSPDRSSSERRSSSATSRCWRCPRGAAGRARPGFRILRSGIPTSREDSRSSETQNLALYPTAALYFVLSPLTAFNLEIVLHFALCAFAAYWLARTLGIGPAGSLVAGAAFALCGFTLSFANLFNRLLAMPNTAFLILFWHLFLLERKRRWFVLAAASGALVVLAGSVEFLLLAALVALGMGVGISLLAGVPGSESPDPRRGAMLLVIVGTAAVQILPGLEVIGQSVRGSGLDFRQAMSWSLIRFGFPSSSCRATWDRRTRSRRTITGATAWRKASR